MASTTLPNQTVTLRTREPARWSAIFAGAFAFLAVETTFGVFGTAIFASAVNPSAAHPVTGMSAGIGIWMLVLTVISLYVAGRVAGHLSGATRKLDGMYHGLVTFGLCIFASVLVTSMILGSAISGSIASVPASTATLSSIISTGGWWLFFSLLLGGWAATVGAVNAIPANVVPGSVRDIRDDNVRRAA